jgi:hypothetical protein
MKRTLKLPLLLIALTIAATGVAISYAQLYLGLRA